MADRICILNFGDIKQVGTPHEVYTYPKNLFVTGFIGSPSMNFLRCINNGENLQIGPINYPIAENWKDKIQRHQKLILGIRPEHINISKILQNDWFKVTLSVTEYMGSISLLTLSIDEKITLKALIEGYFEGKDVQELYITWNVENTHIFDPETEDNLLLNSE